MRESVSKASSDANTKKLWWIVSCMGTFLGVVKGLGLYIWGPYLYDRFGGSASPEAMLLTSSVLVIFSIAATLLELPTGAIADAIGRAHAVMLSWFFQCIYALLLASLFLVHSTAVSFSVVIMGTIILSIAYTLFNGAFVAWKADWMNANTPNVNYTWAASRFAAYRAIGEGIGAVVSILLFVEHLAHVVYLISAALSFGAMIFSMTQMDEVTHLKFVQPYKVTATTLFKRIGEIFGNGIKTTFKSPVIFWTLMVYGGFMFMLNIVQYLWPVYLETIWGTKQFTGGWMALVLVPLVFNFFSARFLAWKSTAWMGSDAASGKFLKAIFILFCLLSSSGVVTLGIATLIEKTSFTLFFIVIALLSISFGIIQPVFEALINRFIPKKHAQERATILSGGSMIRSVLMGVLSIPSGGTTGQSTPIFWMIPATLLIVFTVMMGLVFKRNPEESSTEILNELSITTKEEAV